MIRSLDQLQVTGVIKVAEIEFELNAQFFSNDLDSSVKLTFFVDVWENLRDQTMHIRIKVGIPIWVMVAVSNRGTVVEQGVAYLRYLAGLYSCQ